MGLLQSKPDDLATTETKFGGCLFIDRMTECKLEVHPGKTKIVYCKSDVYPEHHEHESFDFLGYTFRRRIVKSRHGNFFNSFTPAVSK
jgi:RNA-directed DNA polymerase